MPLTILFLLYITDLPFALYPDDTIICYASDNMEELNVIINAELASLNVWLRGNKLSFNVIYTRAMIIGSKCKLSHIKKTSSHKARFNVGNDDIGFVNETKYLGIKIDDK